MDVTLYLVYRIRIDLKKQNEICKDTDEKNHDQ